MPGGNFRGGLKIQTVAFSEAHQDHLSLRYFSKESAPVFLFRYDRKESEMVQCDRRSAKKE